MMESDPIVPADAWIDLKSVFLQEEKRIHEEIAAGKTSFTAWLDVNGRHPELFGDAILPRDDDGMGFALFLEPLRGKYVRITLEVMPEPEERLWPVE